MEDAIAQIAFAMFTADTGNASRVQWEAFDNKDRYMRMANVAYVMLIPPLPAQGSIGASLLRAAAEPVLPGCYCKPGQCMAPKIMGRQLPCRDPQKAAQESVQP